MEHANDPLECPVKFKFYKPDRTVVESSVCLKVVTLIRQEVKSKISSEKSAYVFDPKPNVRSI